MSNGNFIFCPLILQNINQKIFLNNIETPILKYLNVSRNPICENEIFSFNFNKKLQKCVFSNGFSVTTAKFNFTSDIKFIKNPRIYNIFEYLQENFTKINNSQIRRFSQNLFRHFPYICKNHEILLYENSSFLKPEVYIVNFANFCNAFSYSKSVLPVKKIWHFILANLVQFYQETNEFYYAASILNISHNFIMKKHNFIDNFQVFYKNTKEYKGNIKNWLNIIIYAILQKQKIFVILCQKIHKNFIEYIKSIKIAHFCLQKLQEIYNASDLEKFLYEFLNNQKAEFSKIEFNKKCEKLLLKLENLEINTENLNQIKSYEDHEKAILLYYFAYLLFQITNYTKNMPSFCKIGILTNERFNEILQKLQIHYEMSVIPHFLHENLIYKNFSNIQISQKYAEIQEFLSQNKILINLLYYSIFSQYKIPDILLDLSLQDSQISKLIFYNNIQNPMLSDEKISQIFIKWTNSNTEIIKEIYKNPDFIQNYYENIGILLNTLCREKREIYREVLISNFCENLYDFIFSLINSQIEFNILEYKLENNIEFSKKSLIYSPNLQNFTDAFIKNKPKSLVLAKYLEILIFVLRIAFASKNGNHSLIKINNSRVKSYNEHPESVLAHFIDNTQLDAYFCDIIGEIKGKNKSNLLKIIRIIWFIRVFMKIINLNNENYKNDQKLVIYLLKIRHFTDFLTNSQQISNDLLEKSVQTILPKNYTKFVKNILLYSDQNSSEFKFIYNFCQKVFFR